MSDVPRKVALQSFIGVATVRPDMDVALYRLSIPFAIVTGTGAGVLATLSWDVLRGSPVETPLKLLVVVMSIGTVYHMGLLVAGTETLELQSLLVLGYLLVAVALVTAVRGLRADIWSRGVFRHRTVFCATMAGLLVYAIGGPLSEVFFPKTMHWVHGFAALFAVAGLYSPVHDDLRHEPWTELLFADARTARRPGEWMVPMDDAILDVLHSSGLILTPAVISYNTGHSRAQVNRRLRTLESNRLVERVERGKYRLSPQGERYMEGAPVDAA